MSGRTVTVRPHTLQGEMHIAFRLLLEKYETEYGLVIEEIIVDWRETMGGDRSALPTIRMRA
jgi:hypothetical protein